MMENGDHRHQGPSESLVARLQSGISDRDSLAGRLRIGTSDRDNHRQVSALPEVLASHRRRVFSWEDSD